MTGQKHSTLTLLAAALALTPGIARAAEPPCLTTGEFTAIATYALPSIISGAALRCSAVLPAGAFLRTGGDVLVQRYTPIKAAAWPAAKLAFLKLSSGAQGDAAAMVRILPDSIQQQLVDALVAGVIADKVNPERCPSFDRLIQLLSPLPPESTGEVIGLGIGLGARAGQGRVGKLTVCPAQDASAAPAMVPAPVPDTTKP